MEEYFKALMTTPCKVYSVSYLKNSDGTSTRSFGSAVSTVCNFHSANKSELENAGKVAEKVSYIVCLPLDVVVAEGYYIEIEDSSKFRVVGIREASRKFQTIAEVVSCE